MTILAPRLAPQPTPPPPPAEPTVFARTISAPPGFPWDQARMADLEARSTAPLPLGELRYRVRRLETWRPGRPARFTAFYVRASEVGDRLTASAQVDGRPVSIEFLSGGARERQVRAIAMLAIPAGAAVVVVLAVLSAALAARSDATQSLAVAQAVGHRDLSQARHLAHLRDRAKALDQLGLRDQTVQAMAGDLAWLSHVRSTAAHIDAVHWQPGAIALEVRGDTPPFVSDAVHAVKSDKPLRTGVWLWGVVRAAPSRRETP